jgi:predicted thioredoxin/glutaredoxin
MATADESATIAALQAELAEQAARAAAAVARAQEHAAGLVRERTDELARADARIEALERRVWWLDHWGLDPEAVMRTRRGRAAWAAVRLARKLRRG